MEVPQNTQHSQLINSLYGTKIASNSKSSVSDFNTSIHSSEAKSDKKEVAKADEVRITEKAIEAASARKEKSEQDLQKVVENLQAFLQSIDTNLAFKLDEESGKYVVTVYESETGKVIRQIPEQEVLDLYKSLSENSFGLNREKV